MEFFKGVEIPDVLIGIVGLSMVISVIFSNLPFRLWIGAGLAVLFGASVVPVAGEKAYMMVYNDLTYIARFRRFQEAPEKKGIPSVRDITPFTGIDGNFIEYGGEYYGIAVNIPDIEFKFYTLQRQNQMIDQVFGSVLRTISGTETAALVKIDRPVLYDSYIDTEHRKIRELEEAFVNGLLNEEELTTRVGIIYDRMEQIHFINEKEKVYIPFHYLLFFHKDKDLLLSQAQTMIETMNSDDMQCHILSEKELAVFLKYNYTLDFDEREAAGLSRDEYMDWILPREIRFTSRTTRPWWAMPGAAPCLTVREPRW